MLKKLFETSKSLYLDFTVKQTNFAEEAVAPPSSMYEKSPMPVDCFRVSQTIEYKNGDNIFSGCFFYNQFDIPVHGFSSNFKEELYGMVIVEGYQNHTPLFILPYPKALILSELQGIVVNNNKYVFAIAKNSIYGHFGIGNYTPTLEELRTTESQKKVTGCPYSNPDTCTWYKKDDKCAFNSSDNICKKVVGMTGRASISVTSKIS